MSLRDFPLLYDKRGGSLIISFNRGWFCLRNHYSLSIRLRPDSAGHLLRYKRQYLRGKYQAEILSADEGK